MCEQGLGMRPSWTRLSACNRESQQALAALAKLSVSLLAVHAAALQGAGHRYRSVRPSHMSSSQTVHEIWMQHGCTHPKSFRSGLQQTFA